MFKQYLDNRRLVRDLRSADHQVIQLTEDVRKLKAEIKSKEGDNSNLVKSQTKLRSEVGKLKKRIREQCGADLLVNALVELGVVPKPSKDYDSSDEDHRLRSQLSASAQSNYGLSVLQQQGLGSYMGGSHGQR